MADKDKTIQEEPESKSAVLTLIGHYAPEEPEITLTLSKGDTLKFRNEQDTARIKKMHAGAVAFASFVKKQSSRKEFEIYQGLDDTTLQRVFVLAELCMNPDFGSKPAEKHESYATIARKAGYLFREIHTKLDAKCLNYEWNVFGGQVEAAKKDSSPEA